MAGNVARFSSNFEDEEAATLDATLGEGAPATSATTNTSDAAVETSVAAPSTNPFSAVEPEKPAREEPVSVFKGRAVPIWRDVGVLGGGESC